MFERIKGHGMPLVAGVLGASPEVYALALETTVDKIADKWAQAQSHPIPPVRVQDGTGEGGRSSPAIGST